MAVAVTVAVAELLLEIYIISSLEQLVLTFCLWRLNISSAYEEVIEAVCRLTQICAGCD
jgi:hypothetical protein